MVKRKKLSMFLDGKVTTTVLEIKKMIQGITRKAPEEQQLYLYSEKKLMEDNKTLGDYGLTNQTAKAQSPALLVVSYYQNEGMYCIWCVKKVDTFGRLWKILLQIFKIKILIDQSKANL